MPPPGSALDLARGPFCPAWIGSRCYHFADRMPSCPNPVSLGWFARGRLAEKDMPAASIPGIKCRFSLRQQSGRKPGAPRWLGRRCWMRGGRRTRVWNTVCGRNWQRLWLGISNGKNHVRLVVTVPAPENAPLVVTHTTIKSAGAGPTPQTGHTIGVQAPKSVTPSGSKHQPASNQHGQ